MSFECETIELHDVGVLAEQMLRGAAFSRQHGEHNLARLIEAAAAALHQQHAEAKVQRGLAIAAQTLATELATKCESLQLSTLADAGADPLHPHRTLEHAPRATQPVVTPFRRLSADGQAPLAADSPRKEQSTARPSPALLPRAQRLSEKPPSAVEGTESGAPPGSQAQKPPLPLKLDAPQTFKDSGKGNTLDSTSGKTPSPSHRNYKTWVRDMSQPQSAGEAGRASTQRGASVLNGAAAQAQTERDVKAMVEELMARFKSSGVALPLKCISGVSYHLGQRKLHFGMRNGRLMVRVGGGYCDFLEYLAKAPL